MASVTASDFSGGEEETEDHTPTIPELVSSLRDSFQTADFDRAEEALIAREANLKRRFQREAAELTALKKVKEEEEVPDEGKEVIWELKKEKRRLEREQLSVERDVESMESRVLSLEDDVLRLCGENSGGFSVREDHRYSGSVVNTETVFDALIASHANGTLQIPAREAKLDRVIQKQREEFAAREKTHMFEVQKLQRLENEYAALQKKHQCQMKEKDSVENELKGCREEIERLKGELNVMEEKHRVESDEIKQKEQSSHLEALKVEYGCAALQKKHQSQLEEQVKVGNELKHCWLEINRLKGNVNIMEEKHKNECEEIEKKHQSKLLEMLKVKNEIKQLKEEGKVLEEKYKNEYKELEQTNESYYQERLKAEIELKVCKSELDELKEERKVLKQKHQCHLLEVVNELKHCKTELVTLKEELNISNEKCEKFLEEVIKHGKDKDEVVSSRNDKEVKNDPMYVKLENEIMRLDKFINANHLGSKYMDKRSKNNGMTDGTRIKKCIQDPKHVINAEDLYDYVPANASPRGDGVGNSGAPKPSYEGVILLSDSEDDCAPGEPDYLGLKRKRASSPNASDNNNAGHNFEQESSPTSANKKHRMLHPCGSLVSNNGKQFNQSSCDQEILRPSGEKVKEEVASSVKNYDSESSSSSLFSSDGSEDNGDINSMML